MEIPINYDGFEPGRLTLRTGFLASSARLLIDGQPAKRTKGVYLLRNKHGSEVSLKIKSSALDPIPRLEIDGQVLRLAPPLKWYEYAWMGVPLPLLFIGGALGGLCGALAMYSSARVFRSDRGALAKYAITGGISAGALISFMLLAMLLQVFLVALRG